MKSLLINDNQKGVILEYETNTKYTLISLHK